MKLVFVSQPYDRFFPPSQNSIGLIVYYTALELGRRIGITLYGKRYRDNKIPEGLPFKVKSISVQRDRILQRFIRTFPRASRWVRLAGKLDEHKQYRKQVRRRLANDCPDVVHVMNYWNWCRELKQLGSSHRLVLEMQCEWLSQHARDKVGHQLDVVDAVVAVSDHIAKTFRTAFPDYPGLVATVGNGVDVTLFKPRSERAEAIGCERRRILFVGRISPEKGVHTLLEAFGEVAKTFDNVELNIAGPHAPLPRDFIATLSSDPQATNLLRFYDRWGNCTYGAHLDELLVRHRLGGKVCFLGNVPHKDLVAVYQTSEITVNPSLSESFGISVVEAMACGIPVVGTRVGGMCESILSGSTGILVEADAPRELAKALIAILQDPVGGWRMGLEGRKRAVQYYSWQARAERLMSIYRSVVARRPEIYVAPSRPVAA